MALDFQLKKLLGKKSIIHLLGTSGARIPQLTPPAAHRNNQQGVPVCSFILAQLATP